jgi:hypothetical protein
MQKRNPQLTLKRDDARKTLKQMQTQVKQMPKQTNSKQIANAKKQNEMQPMRKPVNKMLKQQQ